MNEEHLLSYDVLVPLSQCAKEVGCKKRTLWRKIAAGDLPKPRRCGKESALWRSELEQYKASLKAKHQ